MRLCLLENVSWGMYLRHPAQLPGRSLVPIYKDVSWREEVSLQPRLVWAVEDLLFPVGEGGYALRIPDQEGMTVNVPKPRNATGEAVRRGQICRLGPGFTLCTPISKSQSPLPFQS